VFTSRPIVKIICLVLFLYSCQQEKKSDVISKTTVVTNEKEIKPIASNAKNDTGLIIYLTFDDGPYKTTPNIVSVLEKENIKTSFFIVGSQRDRSPVFDSIYRRNIQNPMFRFYNHSYSHAITGGRIRRYYRDAEKVLADLEKNRAYIPPSSKMIRLPGKTIWRTSIRNRKDRMTAKLLKLMEERNVNDRIMGWDFSWKKEMSKDISQVDTLIAKIVKKSQKKKPYSNHIVILTHDYLYNSKTALENLAYLIEELKNKYHCSFKWAEEYPD
jgi:peptidoglycan/xylan/chitin deacetylase (PgdA/CDA1 family)